jgi:hypothetical protein
VIVYKQELLFGERKEVISEKEDLNLQRGSVWYVIKRNLLCRDQGIGT